MGSQECCFTSDRTDWVPVRGCTLQILCLNRAFWALQESLKSPESFKYSQSTFQIYIGSSQVPTRQPWKMAETFKLTNQPQGPPTITIPENHQGPENSMGWHLAVGPCPHRALGLLLFFLSAFGSPARCCLAAGTLGEHEGEPPFLGTKASAV